MPLQSFNQDVTLMEVTSLTQLTAYMLFSEMLSVVTHVFTVNDFFYVEYKRFEYIVKENGYNVFPNRPNFLTPTLTSRLLTVEPHMILNTECSNGFVAKKMNVLFSSS